MSDADEAKPPAKPQAKPGSTPPSEPAAPARPTTPRISSRPVIGLSGARPARPRREPAKVETVDEAELKDIVEEPPEAIVIAETTVVAPPPPEPAPPRPPVLIKFGTPFLRQTLFPPCLVLAIGSIALGVGYFLQPADAALRQITPAVPVTLLAVGIVCGAAAFGLARSLRPIDSGNAHS